MLDTVGLRRTSGLWILSRPYNLGGTLALGLSLLPRSLGIRPSCSSCLTSFRTFLSVAGVGSVFTLL